VEDGSRYGIDGQWKFMLLIPLVNYIISSQSKKPNALWKMAYWLHFIFIGSKIEQLKGADSIRRCTFGQNIKNFEQILKAEINQLISY
jgi:hypothetical protein